METEMEWNETKWYGVNEIFPRLWYAKVYLTACIAHIVLKDLVTWDWL